MKEWWSLSGDDLLDMLRRVANGEHPDLVYAEAYANGAKKEERPDSAE